MMGGGSTPASSLKKDEREKGGGGETGFVFVSHASNLLAHFQTEIISTVGGITNKYIKGYSKYTEDLTPHDVGDQPDFITSITSI